MSKTLLALCTLGTCILLIGETASAEPALRSFSNFQETAPLPPSSLPQDRMHGESGGVAAVPANEQEQDYILHCCPPPRGYTPIRCDPRAYNCYRALNQGWRPGFGGGVRPGFVLGR